MSLPRVRVALLVREGDSVLLLQQTREGRSYWLLPGGGLNWGETISDALKRELREELTVTLLSLGKLLWCNDSIAPDGTRHLVNLVFEGRIEGTPTPAAEEGISGCGFFTPAELAAMDLRPPLGNQLRRYLEEGDSGTPYLGPLWTD